MEITEIVKKLELMGYDCMNITCRPWGWTVDVWNSNSYQPKPETIDRFSEKGNTLTAAFQAALEKTEEYHRGRA
jgi:hypothetical protein